MMIPALRVTLLRRRARIPFGGGHGLFDCEKASRIAEEVIVAVEVVKVVGHGAVSGKKEKLRQGL